ncbi:minor capsid protein [Capybara microvirus Cap1_SP_82]|nr:minor capsid protein [Capybara microvirus Cap1_SP_82]
MGLFDSILNIPFQISSLVQQDEAIQNQWEISNRALQNQRELGYEKIASDERINQLNLEENEKARKWQEEMWNKENAYNDPTAQVSRLINAGVNPYVSGSNGSITTGGNNSIPNTNVPNLQQLDYSGLFQANQMQFAQAQQQFESKNKALETFNGVQKLAIENRNTLADIYFKYKNTNNDTLRTIYGNMLTAMQTEQTGVLIELSKVQIDNFRQDIQNKQQQFDFTALQMIGQRLQNSFNEANIPLLLEQTKQNINSIVQDVLCKQAQQNLTEEQARTEISKRVSLAVDNQLKLANIDLINEKVESEKVSRQGMVLENEFQDLENYKQGATLNEDLSIKKLATGIAHEQYNQLVKGTEFYNINQYMQLLNNGLDAVNKVTGIPFKLKR